MDEFSVGQTRILENTAEVVVHRQKFSAQGIQWRLRALHWALMDSFRVFEVLFNEVPDGKKWKSSPRDKID